MNDHEVYCPRCREWYMADAFMTCPSCGYDNEDEADAKNDEAWLEEDSDETV